MGEKNVDEISASACSVHPEDPSLSTAANSDNEPKAAESDDIRRPTKRKNCPSPLEKFDTIRPCSADSSFSFGSESRSEVDPEPTPRFGSFGSAAAEQSKISKSVLADGSAGAEASESDADREPKRRKSCPSSIDPSFSFNLDHNSDGSPEPTPKFGSFNFAAAELDSDQQHQIPAISEINAGPYDDDDDDDEEEEEEGEVGSAAVDERREIGDVLS